MAEIFEEEVFERKLRSLEEGYRRRFGEDFRYDVQEEIQRFQVCLRPVLPSSLLLEDHLFANAPLQEFSVRLTRYRNTGPSSAPSSSIKSH
jgi:hypothetical protein